MVNIYEINILTAHKKKFFNYGIYYLNESFIKRELLELERNSYKLLTLKLQ